MRLERTDPHDCCYVHLTLMPYISTAGELKTKPTQSSVRALRSAGIQPDVIVCRTEKPMTGEGREKIALFCNVTTANVIQNMDVDPLCELPLVLEKEGLARAVLFELRLPDPEPDLGAQRAYVQSVKDACKTLRVALVGKYTAVPDAYLSVTEALRHAAAQNGARPEISLVDAGQITPETAGGLLGGYDAIVVPGGYGDRGVDGMIAAARYARESATPFLAIGFGMQLAVVEAARSLLGIADAHTAEGRSPYGASRGPHPAGPRLSERQPQRHAHGRQRREAHAGAAEGAVRRGGGARAPRQPLRGGPRLSAGAGTKGIQARGRERGGGLPRGVCAGGHPFYAAVVYHPEYISRPGKAHPLFSHLVRSGLERK